MLFIEQVMTTMENIPDTVKSGKATKTFVAVKDHLSSDLGGESVILSMSTGKYYGLNRISQDIWTAIRTPQTLDNIVEMLREKYEVERETCVKEVSAVLEKLTNEGLVKTILKEGE